MAANKPRTARTRNKESRHRIDQWRIMAIAVAGQHPTWSAVQIAQVIQNSAVGRKSGGKLTYSVDFIARNIRGAWR